MKSAVFISIAFCIVASCCCSCKSNTVAAAPAKSLKDFMPIGSYTYKTNAGWGYCITVDNKIYINQSTIPDVDGYKSFVTEADAAKVADLVLNKIKTHQRPSIFKAELEKLGIAD